MIRKRKGVQPLRCTTEQNELGEGARWDARRDELLRVDIVAGRIYRDTLADDGALIPVREYSVPDTVGPSCRWRAMRAGCSLPGGNSCTWRPTARCTIVDAVSPAGTRMNDAVCGTPQEASWAGTLADDHHAGGGALYRLDTTGQIDTVLTGLTISNGLGWSTDGGTMYFVDSGPRIIYAFDFDGNDGTISDRRTLVAVDSGTRRARWADGRRRGRSLGRRLRRWSSAEILPRRGHSVTS